MDFSLAFKGLREAVSNLFWQFKPNILSWLLLQLSKRFPCGLSMLSLYLVKHMFPETDVQVMIYEPVKFLFSVSLTITRYSSRYFAPNVNTYRYFAPNVNTYRYFAPNVNA